MTLLLKSEQTLSPMPTGHTHKKHPKPRKKEHNQNSKCRFWCTMCMVYCGLFLSFVVLCWVVCYFKADVCAVCVLCVLCVLCVCCVCAVFVCVCPVCVSCACPVCVLCVWMWVQLSTPIISCMQRVIHALMGVSSAWHRCPCRWSVW